MKSLILALLLAAGTANAVTVDQAMVTVDGKPVGVVFDIENVNDIRFLASHEGVPYVGRVVRQGVIGLEAVYFTGPNCTGEAYGINYRGMYSELIGSTGNLYIVPPDATYYNGVAIEIYSRIENNYGGCRNDEEPGVIWNLSSTLKVEGLDGLPAVEVRRHSIRNKKGRTIIRRLR